MNKDIKCPECNTTLDLNSLLSEQNKNELFNEFQKDYSDSFLLAGFFPSLLGGGSGR